MSLTSAKRSRPSGRHELHPNCWELLEPGIWENVFQKLAKVEDKKNARLTCKLFKDAASRSIHYLDFDKSSTLDRKELNRLAKELPGSLKYIESLRLYPSIVLSRHGCQLHAFSCLKKLDYQGWGLPLPPKTVAAICSLDNLRELTFSDCQIHENSKFQLLTSLQSLKGLELLKCQPWGNGVGLMSIISSLTGLTHLRFFKPYTFCDRGYAQLDSLTSLKSLQLGYSWMLGVGRERMNFISSLTFLRKLSITKCFVSDRDLEGLQSLVNLQLLGICESNRITGTLFSDLTSLTALHGLTLEGSNHITDEGVLSISKLTSLQQLHLGSSHFITLEACKEALPALTGLKRLRLPRSIIAMWPASEASICFPGLKSYIAAPLLDKRYQMVIEDNLLQWALLQPELLEAGRSQILDWFHEQRC